jgi:dihydroneopterin aldolase
MPQPIDVHTEIKFFEELRGCTTDNLEDVVCYHTLTEKIIESLRGKSFHLIEFVAKQIFETVASFISLGAILAITITKPNHPVPHVQKGISFKYSRRIPQKSL